MPSSAEDKGHLDLAGEGLEAGYGAKPVLRGIDIKVRTGEIVAVIGHNGAGKSTLLKALVGLLPLTGGKVIIDGQVSRRANSRDLGRRGLTLVPQGARVFSTLTTRENLELCTHLFDPASGRALQSRLDRVLELLASLKPLLNRRAGVLSGGERQFLAMAMGLARHARLLLLDEPSLGLSAALTERVMETLSRLRDEREYGFLMVEQKIRQVLTVADRVYILKTGRVTFAGAAEQLRDQSVLARAYL